MERLQKKIANSGFCSRRSAEELIKDGRVRVNDEVITMMGYKVSDKDKIFVDDKLIVNEEKIYFLLNKPRGVISTTDDDKTLLLNFIESNNISKFYVLEGEKFDPNKSGIW